MDFAESLHICYTMQLRMCEFHACLVSHEVPGLRGVVPHKRHTVELMQLNPVAPASM